MKIGLIGLANSGKTTLFNLLTGSNIATARYDSGRAELHTGVARVPDPRVDRLSALFKPKKTTYATFEVVDLAGIARGERAGLDTKDFRNADALLHVVRAFADEAQGAPAPKRDIEDLETELILADLEVVDRRLERLEASIKEQRVFLADLGLDEPAIHRVLSDCFALLGLVSFFTVGEDEVRAWPIPAGTRAQDAAGTVHSDIARGFIRAEVNSYDDLVAVDGAFAELRAKGQLRLEGKDYVVRDGEICHFRFNVGK